MTNKEIRNYFPAAKKMIYLDSAALSLKPKSAIDAVCNFYTNISVSTRTRNTKLNGDVLQTISDTRNKVAKLTDSKPSEVIFTSGTTESINLFSYMIEPLIKENKEIILDVYNHSSNMICWMELARRKNCKLIFSDNVVKDITKNTILIALSQKSNTFTNHYDLKVLYKICKKQQIFLINDAAQAISSEKVSLNNSDMIAFSANKFYGPTGLGCLIVKEELLNKLKPVKTGGGAITRISKDKSIYFKNDIQKWEAGTPNLAGIYMFNASLNFFLNIGYENTKNLLNTLSTYAYEKLNKVKGIEIYSSPNDNIIMFNLKEVFCEDVASFLGENNIYVRSGFFCAQYLPFVNNTPGFIRVSLGIYNTKDDIDKLCECLELVKTKIFI
ncbi:aminotransferase class V-fold PLP-dependent enzyme [Mycoplasma elephantis]|uniref:aminotransferase class V-fold PLP-dependent enzyme n=1 Tax=Mycoplasma elephantis TaxID=114882 RepID=UPI0004844748|nr:aminotransferase class V-fold PLP-dependent enzyme [Mycoplasma elephantis]